MLLLATTPRMAHPELELSGIHHAQLIADEAGERRLSQATDTRVAPGAERHYTLQFINTSEAPTAGLKLDFPLPVGLGYVPVSATGPGAVISLSIDGGASFVPESDLGDRATRASHLRWTFDVILYPRTTGIVSFRGRGRLPPLPPAEALPAIADPWGEDRQGTDPGDWSGSALPTGATAPADDPGPGPQPKPEPEDTGSGPADGSNTGSHL